MDADSLFRLFRRALRACQLYPSDGPVRQETMRETHRGFALAIGDRAEGLSFSFLEDGAFVEGRPIRSTGDDAGAALARQIYALGVRELRFLPGLTAVELSRLVDPLSLALLGYLNPVDEDLSVLLWEADLRCIGYQLYEEDTGSEPEPEEADDGLTVRPSYNEYVDQEVVIGGSEAPGLFVRLGEQEKLRLLASYRKEEEDEVPFKYARLVLELLQSETEPSASARIVPALTEFLTTLAQLGRFALLERIEHSLAPSGAVSPLEAYALGAVSEWFVSPAFLHSLADAPPAGGTDGSAGDQPAADRLFMRLPPSCVPDLVARGLESCRDRVLAKLTADPEARVACLKDHRPRLRETAIDAMLMEGCVRAPRRSQEPRPEGNSEGNPARNPERNPEPSEEILLLGSLLQDPQVGLRRLAVRALALDASPASRAALVQALRDPQEEIRTAAADALAHQGDRAALEPLLRILLSKDFERRTRSEQRAFFMAAGKVAPAEVCPVLARTAERRSWLAGRNHRDKQDAALEALSSLGPEARAFVLRRWQGRRSDLLRRMEAA